MAGDRNNTPAGAGNRDRFDALMDEALKPEAAPSGLASQILARARAQSDLTREAVLDGVLIRRWLMPASALAVLLLVSGFGTGQLMVDPIAVADADMTTLFSFDSIAESL
jgi:hypothetical protein